jgi:succinyl-CoA synthetase beta subunit
VVVNALVLVGGGGRAGGVKLAKNEAELNQYASQILGMEIKGIRVKKVLIAKAIEIKQEYYLGLTLDRAKKAIVIMLSSEGGVEIEEVAAKTPEKIFKFWSADTKIDTDKLTVFVRQVFPPDKVAAAASIAQKLFEIYIGKDCTLVEINPLVETKDGKIVALDSKILFDDNALERHPDISALRDFAEEDAEEIEAKEAGLSFVKLDGSIGCMINGAGLAMATLDMIKLFGGEPANFLDVGGSSNPKKVVKAFEIILRSKAVKVILINIFGGITRCDDIARGILEAFGQMTVPVPVVVRLAGTNEKEGQEMLKGTDLIVAADLEDGIKKAIRI